MLKDIVEIIKNTALRHKGVRTFRYQADDRNNAQNNYGTYQVYLDDVSLHQLNITSGIFKAQFELYVLAHPDDKKSILDIQNEAYTIAVNILGYIDTRDEWQNVLDVYDYSILTLSHYSDDDSAGVKLTLVLEMPSPLNFCTLEDNFNDEPYEEPQDRPIDIPTQEDNDWIDINPIRLPRNRTC